MNFHDQGVLLREVAAALSAERVTRPRWDRVKVAHGTVHTAGQQIPGLGAKDVRIEVGLLTFVDYEEDGDRHRRHDLETVTYDLPDDTEDIPRHVVERVRAHLEEK